MMDQKTRDDLLKLFQGKLNEAMQFYLETCTRCGVCTEAFIRNISKVAEKFGRQWVRPKSSARWPSMNSMTRPTPARAVGAAWCIARSGLTLRC
jgi:hypothetical protein